MFRSETSVHEGECFLKRGLGFARMVEEQIAPVYYAATGQFPTDAYKSVQKLLRRAALVHQAQHTVRTALNAELHFCFQMRQDSTRTRRFADEYSFYLFYLLDDARKRGGCKVAKERANAGPIRHAAVLR